MLGSAFALVGEHYDFGTMQKGGAMTTFPGGEANASLYFFLDALYGNRITHVVVAPEKVPEGWEVTLDPPAHEQILNISGIRTVSNENLYVEPRDTLPRIPEPPEEGVTYLLSPSGLGYLQAKEITVNIKVPQTAEIGKTYGVSVVAEGFWFGKAGLVSLKQSRVFSYKVTVLQKDYTESIMTTLAGGNETQELAPSAEGENIQAYIITALALALVLLAIYSFFIKGKR